MDKAYDTFISYRRDGGGDVAGRVYDFLCMHGFKPYHDVDSIEAGRFDEQIQNNLIQSENYILILSPNALDRCKNPEDWVRFEISTAIAHNLNIIVLKDDEFVYPTELPEDIQTLPKYQTIAYNQNSLSSRLENLEKSLKRPQSLFNLSSSDTVTGKLSFSGKYITKYEDKDRDKTIWCTAPAELHRFLNKVWGKTWFSGSKAWKISGHVYGGKRLAGIYAATGKLDEGFGTFYLELKNDNSLDGYWSGYDNENHTITTGKYLFKKQNTAYKLRYANASDFPTIVRIADAQLGKDFVTEKYLKEVLNDKESTFCLVVYNKKNSKVVGFCISKQITYDELKEITWGKDISELKYAGQIGYIMTISIDEQFKNYGLGTTLVNECINVLKKSGITCFVSTAWKHNGIINIGSILEKDGFQQKIEIPNYWYQSSIDEGFNCPSCGNPCHCSCVIYVKI